MANNFKCHISKELELETCTVTNDYYNVRDCRRYMAKAYAYYYYNAIGVNDTDGLGESVKSVRPMAN